MISKAIVGLKYLFIGKLISKLIETVLSIFVLREIDKSIYGVTVYFDLFNSLSLFYVKQCLKSCYQKRQGGKESERVQSARNLMYFGVLVTMGLNAVLFGVFAFFYGKLSQYFLVNLGLYSLACFFDCLVEPLNVEDVLNFEY